MIFNSSISEFYFLPEVAATTALELLGAERMRDVLDGVAKTVSVVVGGVDAPLVARAVMGGVLDAVRDRVLFKQKEIVKYCAAMTIIAFWLDQKC